MQFIKNYNEICCERHITQYTARRLINCYLTGSKPGKWWGSFPYQAFEVDNNVFLTSWFEEGYGDYVTLLINFNNNLLYGSAILSGKTVHFHGAKIVKVNSK